MRRQLKPFFLLLIGFLLAVASEEQVQACGWFRCWFCSHHGYASYSASGGYSSPAQAPMAAQQAPMQQYVYAAPTTMYYAAPIAAPQQAPAGAQNFLPEVASIIEILKIAKSLRNELSGGHGGDQGSNTEGATSSGDLGEVKATLTRLEESQKDLRGRLINNAGISQSIGLKLVEVNERVATVEKSVGATGDIIGELQKINKSIRELAEAKPTVAPADETTAQLQKNVESLQKDVGGLKSQIGEIHAKLIGEKEKATVTDKDAKPAKNTGEEAKNKASDGKKS